MFNPSWSSCSLLLIFSTLHDPTRPLVQAKQTLRRSLNTPELLRQSQYAVVSEIESFPNQPQISPEPTPRAEVTTFSSKTSLASPVHSSRSDGTSTTSARAHHVSAVRQSRYAELRTPPPTPPPAVPLPPLPTPAVVLPSRSYTMSDVGIALSSDVPICLNSLKPPLEQFYHDPHHLPRRFRSASSPLTFTTHFGPAVSHPRAPLNARRALPPPRSRNDIRQSQCVRATVRHHEKGNHLTGVTRAEWKRNWTTRTKNEGLAVFETFDPNPRTHRVEEVWIFILLSLYPWKAFLRLWIRIVGGGRCLKAVKRWAFFGFRNDLRLGFLDCLSRWKPQIWWFNSIYRFSFLNSGSLFGDMKGRGGWPKKKVAGLFPNTWIVPNIAMES